ncbi:MAG: hypothetical protein GX811_11990, partial [Lentisphaerae bacterium]|nr:hypothetical protein [Lentisphaerota bacterium]
MYDKGLIFFLLMVAGIMLTVKIASCAEFPEPPRGVGNWPEERGTEAPRKRGDGSKIQSLGNHRAVIKVAESSDAVWVRIPWRRRDIDADKKAVLVFDSKDKQVENIVCVEINSEFGDILFQPTNGPGEYYFYYMPYTYQFIEGSGDYRLNYDPPQFTAEPDWISKNHLAHEQLTSTKWKELPRATVVEIQARTEFDRFDPMEVCATKSELSELAAKNPGQSYLLFVEDRRDPI